MLFSFREFCLTPFSAPLVAAAIRIEQYRLISERRSRVRFVTVEAYESVRCSFFSLLRHPFASPLASFTYGFLSEHEIWTTFLERYRQ